MRTTLMRVKVMIKTMLFAVVLIVPVLAVATTSTAKSMKSSVLIVRSYVNDTVRLPCHVEDLGLQVRVRWWYKPMGNATNSLGSNITKAALLADSEETLMSSGQARIKMWGNRSLELVQVRPEDSGKYVCQASRPEPWGNVTQEYEIQVMYSASVKTIPESGQLEVKLGDEAEMTCITDGSPKATLSWKFEGQELPILTSGQRLRIHASNRSLAGIYTCEASNGVGEPAKANIELKIKHKPEVTAISRWIHSAPGIRAQLECLVIAWPEAHVDWHFEGEKLPRSSRLIRTYKQDEISAGQLHSLIIRSAEAYDLGPYTCVATNELGSANSSIELSGLPKPPLLKKESRTSSSHSYNFIWEVDSYSPIVEYQFWFRQLDTREDWRRLFIPSGNEPAGPLHARSFNLTGLQVSRQYEALVLARNRFGWSSPSKIVRFSTGSTLSTSAEGEEAYKIDSPGHENIPPAVQVTSDSHRSALDANSSESVFLYNGFLILLPLLLMAFTTLRS